MAALRSAASSFFSSTEMPLYFAVKSAMQREGNSGEVTSQPTESLPVPPFCSLSITFFAFPSVAIISSAYGKSVLPSWVRSTSRCERVNSCTPNSFSRSLM